MSFVAGIKGRSLPIYPVSPGVGGGGGGGSSTPLARLRWVDGNTTVPPGSQNGSESAPYDSPERWFASLGAPTTLDDSATWQVGVMAPTAASAWNPNPQTWTIPPSRVILLTAFAQGLIIDPAFSPITIVWNNTAAAGATYSRLGFERFVMGAVTMTLSDGVGSPVADMSLDGSGSSELAFFSFNSFDYSAMNNADALFIAGCGVVVDALTPNATPGLQFILSVFGVSAEYNAGDSESWFLVSVGDGAIIDFAGGTTLTAQVGLSCLSGQWSVPAITVVSGPTTFESSRFLIPCVLTAPGGAVFDGSSWASFREAGSTYGTTVVLVVGGYNQGAVPGANIDSSGGGPALTPSLALNGVGASAAFTQGGNWYTATVLSAGDTTTVSLLDGAGAGAEEGDTLQITRTDATATAIFQVQDATIGAPFARLTGLPGFVKAVYHGGAWVLDSMGTAAI